MVVTVSMVLVEGLDERYDESQDGDEVVCGMVVTTE